MEHPSPPSCAIKMSLFLATSYALAFPSYSFSFPALTPISPPQRDLPLSFQTTQLDLPICSFLYNHTLQWFLRPHILSMQLSRVFILPFLVYFSLTVVFIKQNGYNNKLRSCKQQYIFTQNHPEYF